VGSPRAPQFGPPEGGEGSKGVGGSGRGGRGLGFVWLRLAFRGGASVGRRACSPTSSPPPPRQRVGSERRSRAPQSAAAEPQQQQQQLQQPAAACRRLLPLSAPRSAASPPRRRRLRSPPPRGRLLSRSRSRAAGREVDVKEPQSGEVMKSSNFELARDGLEMVPSRSPGVGASQLGRDGPAPPLRRAAGALGQLCRQTCSGKFWRRSGTGGTPGRIWTDHIVQIHGGEPPRAHRRDGSRGTGPRRQRGESCSRRPADMAVRKAGLSAVRLG